MPRRATLTFEEDSSGEVYLEVRTRERLGALTVGDRVLEPREYLGRAVAFEYVGTEEHPPIMPHVRVSSMSGRLVSRWLDISAGTKERRLVARLVGQARARVVWRNEGLEFVLAVREREGPILAAALRVSPDMDRQTWRELTRELDWLLSESYRPGAPRPTRHRRRRASPPSRPIDHFATCSGALPRAGSPRVAGVRLPRGSRLPEFAPAYWSTDDAVGDAERLAESVADAFPEVGLWPLLWRYAEGPEEYLAAGGALDRIEAIDVDGELAARRRSLPVTPQATTPFAAEFPGLGGGLSTAEPSRTISPAVPDARGPAPPSRLRG